MQETRLKGNFTGGNIIYGYKVVDKKIVINEEEAEVVRFIYKNYASGVYVKYIIEELTKKGILKNGKPFARNTIYNILKNERYSGVYHYNGVEYTNAFPRIVPEEIYSVVRQRNIESKYGKHVSVIYLLKNKVTCGYCGKSITSESGTSSNGQIRRYYKCLTRKRGSKCKKKSIKKDLLENLVIDTTLKIFNTPENISRISEKIMEINKERVIKESEINHLTKEKNNIKKAIDNLLDCMEQGIISTSTKERLERLEKQLEAVNNRIIMEKTNKTFQITQEDIIKYIKKALKHNIPFIVRTLIKNVVLYDDKIEIYFNYTDQEDVCDLKEPIQIFKDNQEVINDYRHFNKEPERINLKINGYVK